MSLLAIVSCAAILTGLVIAALAAGRHAQWKADREREWIRDQLLHSLRDIQDEEWR